MTPTRETARQIAERIRKGIPPKRPLFISEAKPVKDAVVITNIGAKAA